MIDEVDKGFDDDHPRRARHRHARGTTDSRSGSYQPADYQSGDRHPVDDQSYHPSPYGSPGPAMRGGSGGLRPQPTPGGYPDGGYPPADRYPAAGGYRPASYDSPAGDPTGAIPAPGYGAAASGRRGQRGSGPGDTGSFGAAGRGAADTGSFGAAGRGAADTGGFAASARGTFLDPETSTFFGGPGAGLEREAATPPRVPEERHRGGWRGRRHRGQAEPPAAEPDVDHTARGYPPQAPEQRGTPAPDPGPRPHPATDPGRRAPDATNPGQRAYPAAAPGGPGHPGRSGADRYPDEGFRGDRYPDARYPGDRSGGYRHPADQYAGEGPADQRYVDVRHPDGQYVEGHYPDGRYVDGGYPGGYQAGDRYPEGHYPDERYPDERYPDERYPDERYPDERYPDERYPDGYHAEGYPDERYPDGYHAEGYPDERYSEDPRPEGGYVDDRYPAADVPTGQFQVPGQEWPRWDTDGDEEEPEPTGSGTRGGSGRAGRGGRRGGKRGRGRSLLALAMTLILLGALGAGAFFGIGRIRDYFIAPDYSGSGTGSVIVQVQAGETLTDVANTLVTKNVVKSAAAFVDAARNNPRAKSLETGFYRLHQRMKATLALDMLLARDKNGNLINKVSHRVTIPEGYTVNQTLAALAKGTGIPLASFQQAAKDPVALGIPDWWFKRDDGKKAAASLEGFLFPDTYDFDPNASATDILKQMVGEFLNVTGDLNFATNVQQNRKITPYEALIVASLAQAEAGNASDLGKVARVAYNRVFSGNFPCSCLQFDVLVNYWRQLNGQPTIPSKDMTMAQLNDPKNPYNGYNSGLPPGPIDNPGKAALEAAMNPTPGNWLYFVAIDKQGHSAFSSTLSQFQADQAKACAAHITC